MVKPYYLITKTFIGVADFDGTKIYRKLTINDGIITVEDFSVLRKFREIRNLGRDEKRHKRRIFGRV